MPYWPAALFQLTKLVGVSAPGWPLACRSLVRTLPVIGATVPSETLLMSFSAFGTSSTMVDGQVWLAELVVPSDTLSVNTSVSSPPATSVVWLVSL